MKRIRKSGEERRLEIIEATLRLAAKHGPDRITADIIAHELGISQPAIFRHFPRKGDIWTATIGWLQECLTALWNASINNASPEDRLPALIKAHFEFIENHPALPLVLLSSELQIRHDAMRHAVIGLMSLFHAKLKGAVEDGQAHGCYKAGLNSTQAAWMLIALIQGVALRWTASQASFKIVKEGVTLTSMALQGLKG
ncbi:MAG: TetR/AcrR family transcriptional regulator [Rhodospirillales bacterium]|nr:TetR/AcrR family transcriptional regulator [Rhodospirillales bacterium]